MRRLERDENGRITTVGRVQRLEGIVQVQALVLLVAVLMAVMSGCAQQTTASDTDIASTIVTDPRTGKQCTMWVYNDSSDGANMQVVC
ncbi:hypothetical protein MYRNA_57 [Mycobacterium phage Myrna]|uniref:Uncharacterized protein n=1 Tax=Mycobacterium phage Myrna TaxID=546805 RepID=B5LJ68_9CAUD|nr:gp57 [Mycobacterium phage Myrna]ACH62065.1 hypothetical protein MYRNA_57 [Mycobacterium phage Myrna]